jgi:hypothetical protein
MKTNNEIKYKIAVKTINDKFLTYTVDKYDIIEQCIISFLDLHTNSIRQYPLVNCQIEVVKNND